MNAFPDRFDYGPDLGALDFMIEGSMLENTLTHFGNKGWGGIIRTYETTEQDHTFTEYTVIIDSLPGNRTIVTDTIFITKGIAAERKADFCSFDTANFSGSRTYYTQKFIEMGLVEGDTVVGIFSMVKTAQTDILPVKIFCYGNPAVIWKVFYQKSKLFLWISALLMFIPLLVLVNMVWQKLKLM